MNYDWVLSNEVLKTKHNFNQSLTKQCNAGVMDQLNCAGTCRLAIGRGAKVLTPTTFLLAVRKLLFHYIMSGVFTSHEVFCITISYFHNLRRGFALLLFIIAISFLRM